VNVCGRSSEDCGQTADHRLFSSYWFYGFASEPAAGELEPFALTGFYPSSLTGYIPTQTNGASLFYQNEQAKEKVAIHRPALVWRALIAAFEHCNYFPKFKWTEFVSAFIGCFDLNFPKHGQDDSSG
jgi:hypothetical protein